MNKKTQLYLMLGAGAFAVYYFFFKTKTITKAAGGSSSATPDSGSSTTTKSASKTAALGVSSSGSSTSSSTSILDSLTSLYKAALSSLTSSVKSAGYSMTGGSTGTFDLSNLGKKKTSQSDSKSGSSSKEYTTDEWESMENKYAASVLSKGKTSTTKKSDADVVLEHTTGTNLHSGITQGSGAALLGVSNSKSEDDQPQNWYSDYNDQVPVTGSNWTNETLEGSVNEQGQTFDDWWDDYFNFDYAGQ